MRGCESGRGDGCDNLTALLVLLSWGMEIYGTVVMLMFVMFGTYDIYSTNRSGVDLGR